MYNGFEILILVLFLFAINIIIDVIFRKKTIRKAIGTPSNISTAILIPILLDVYNVGFIPVLFIVIAIGIILDILTEKR